MKNIKLNNKEIYTAPHNAQLAYRYQFPEQFVISAEHFEQYMIRLICVIYEKFIKYIKQFWTPTAVQNTKRKFGNFYHGITDM